MAIETTLVLVKPDGISRGLAGEIVARFERRGYELRGARLLKIPRALAAEHYAEHKGKPFYGELVAFITSGPVLALAVRGENAIAGVRAMMGATNPADAAPGTIRGDFATRAFGEHRARLRLAGEREARARPVLPRRALSVEALGRELPSSRRMRVEPDRVDGSAPEYVEAAERAWATDQPYWGIWGVPESDVGALDGIELAGTDVVELGCGTAYWSAWLARRGASPVGIDVTDAQLETARRMQAEHGLDVPADPGERRGRAAAGRVVRPRVLRVRREHLVRSLPWIPEAARLLRPGGRLVFLVNGTLSILCSPDDEDAPVDRRCCATTSACIASNGPMRLRRSSSISATATGSGCCGRTASRSRT